MALSSGTRSLFGELASWVAAAAILVAGLVHYETLRTALGDALGFHAVSGPAATAVAAPPSLTPHADGVETLQAFPDGHYYATADVNGRALDVMVDTGASVVALTYEDAERAGLRLKRSDFTARVNTANGPAAVAPVMLDSVSIGRITVRDVRAAVSEPGRLEKTLLGMSFLSRLNRMDISRERLTLVE